MNIDPDAALTFLSFVEARHQAYENRQLGLSFPWTQDPIVNAYKFTNVFRILDYGTQFILTDLVADDPSPRDLLMRLFLYRHTGRVEVWRELLVQMGGYPTVEDLDDVLEVWKEYRGDAHIRTRTADPRNAGRKTQTDFKRSVFTGAYLVFPQSQVKGTDKLESIIDLTKRLFTRPDVVVNDFLDASSQAERFNTLRRNKGVADFMSMQILTDWGYTLDSGEDREDEFVVPGPGARKGAASLSLKAKAEDVLLWAVEAVRTGTTARLELDDYGTSPEYPTRQPSYMDVQNCLCEFSKYVRYMKKPIPANPYQPAHPGPQPAPVLPKHW